MREHEKCPVRTTGVLILLTLTSTGLGTQSNTITMAINQAMLATMVGTTRSRIN